MKPKPPIPPLSRDDLGLMLVIEMNEEARFRTMVLELERRIDEGLMQRQIILDRIGDMDDW